MKINLKDGNKEATIEYETRWWGTEFQWHELFRVLPFLIEFFNKEKKLK